MNYDLIETGPVVTKEVINNFERENNISLPEDYIEFLLKNNGGMFIYDYVNFDFKDKLGDNTAIVDIFYGINYPADVYDLKTMLNRTRDRMPNNIIPIANDPGGNKICISIKGEDYGKVYFWDHEFEADEDEKPDYRNLSLIANSFTEFFKLLKVNE